MAITINHQTNAITATAGSVSINGSVPSASGLTLLETATSGNTVIFELTSFSDTYTNYIILFAITNVNGNAQNLRSQFKFGSTYSTANYASSLIYTNDFTTATQGWRSTYGASDMLITPDISLNTNENIITGQMNLLDARNTGVYKSFACTWSMNRSGSVWGGTSYGSAPLVTTAISGIKFYFGGGNVRGTVRLYGVAS